ncbi:MAG: nickel pincer cofactor biosynthesis protein LarB [Nitrososphaeria archaeon]
MSFYRRKMSVREVLEKLVKGTISIEEAEKEIHLLAINEVEGLAKFDSGREDRSGVPEIILAEGKSSDAVVKIALVALESRGRVIISRVNDECIKRIESEIGNEKAFIRINKEAKMVVLKKKNFAASKKGGKVGILTAGTADIPVAEEAKVVLEEMGCKILTAYDVGVAGIHRLLPELKRMIEEDVDVIIVVAGREGALPSVVAGLVNVPVIGVPTSIGYGLGGMGIASLLAMLQSCTPGLLIVNIDNGVSAGVAAALIANRAARKYTP